MTQDIPVVLQMHTVRDHAQDDMAGTLRQVAAMGYQGVELAKGYGDLTREQCKEVMDETNLQVAAIHVPLPRLKNDLEDVVAEAGVFGNRYVVLGFPGNKDQDEAGWRQLAETLNDAGTKLHQHGLQLCYHNHAFEFEKQFGGGYLLDFLLSITDPQLVQSELDVYWVKKGGEEPVDYIKKYAGRVPLLHIKDMGADGYFAEIGVGTLDWPEIFNAAEASGTQYYIVEQDFCSGDSLDSARLSADNLKKWGKLKAATA